MLYCARRGCVEAGHGLASKSAGRACQTVSVRVGRFFKPSKADGLKNRPT